MDKKSLAIVTLCIAGLVGWYFWQVNRVAEWRKDNPLPVVVEEPASAKGEGIAKSGSAAPGTAAAAGASDVPEATPGEIVTLETEYAIFQLTSTGGGIDQVSLKKQAAFAEEGDDAGFVVINKDGKAPIGALGAGSGDLGVEDFAVVSKSATEVVFQGTRPDGVQVTKTFSTSDSREGGDPHLLDLSVKLNNKGTVQTNTDRLFLYTGAASPFQAKEWIRPRFSWDDKGDPTKLDVNKFGEGKFLIKFRDARPEIATAFEELRWAGNANQFYATLIAPAVRAPATSWASRFNVGAGVGKNVPRAVHGGVSLPSIDLPVGQVVTLDYTIYTGPKERTRLKALGAGQEGAMFYGFFSPISALLNNVLNLFQGWVTNWGIAILLLTLCIRILIWPLHHKSTKTMKRMSLLSPKMKTIREKHADDPQKMNGELMKLYRDYGVNPMAGCLPVFLQLPIFLGFFRMLQSTAELRGAEFLWVKDLSMPDTIGHIAGFPINPLPIVMGVTMLIQMMITPKTGDKMQQRMLYIMPVMFLVFCYGYAAALALYWTGSNIFSIFQTWITRMQPDPELVKKDRSSRAMPNASGGGSGGGGKGGGDGAIKKNSGPRTGGGGRKKKK